MEKIYSITYLRAFCAIEVFLLHYCATIAPQFMSIFCGAVPTFLVMSSYIYGLKRESRSFSFSFLKRRFIVLGVTYYPFVLSVFAYYMLTETGSKSFLLNGLLVDLLYLGGIFRGANLPHCGHLWFLTTLALCYVALFLFGNNKRIEKLFTSPKGLLSIVTVVALLGFVYKGGG